MAISPVQSNIENTSSHKPYREANYTVKTDNNVKPLPPNGHLVHDRVSVMPKYFIKDFAYDLESVKEGFNGTANDHRTGRLNDVGLKLGGIGIATMLAARTSNPVARVMEYVGLGTFLAAMNLYPKLAIQAPARAKHGFDTGIEYIDDQGRKKSMFQDPNYIPFDNYRGERRSEDLDVIGDRLGIPRNIENRHDVIKEQMRKIAIQNNTLWMLTAGFATPVLTALACCGLEKVVSDSVQSIRNAHHNSKIASLLKSTEGMAIDAESIVSNSLSNNVEQVLYKFKDAELPKEDFEKIVDLMTKNLDDKVSAGIKQDLANIVKSGKNSFYLGEKASEDIINTIKNNISSSNKNALEKVFVPTKEELDKIITSQYVTEEALNKIKSDLKALFKSKFSSVSGISEEYLTAEQNRIIESISKSIQKVDSRYINDNTIKEISNFAKVIGEFKENDKVLDKCKSFKFEYAPETVLAKSYGKFEKTLFKVLDIKYKDLKLLKESGLEEAEKLVVKKFEEVAKDEKKYEKAIKSLTKVMDEMDVVLNGKNPEKSNIMDLINAIENNYNNTAKRLNSMGNDKFKNTIDMLVKQDVNDLGHSIHSKEDLLKVLDGLQRMPEGADKLKFNAKEVGSSKNLEISRIIERYQGANNSFRRILHTLDVFKREIPGGEYDKQILEKGKEALLKADTAIHTLKFNTVNNPTFYKDIMNTIYSENLQESTQKAMESVKDASKNDVQGRFKSYITRFKEVMANNNIDFTKPEHKLNPGDLHKYTKSSQTRMSKFNLVGQSPMDMIQKAAERRYGTQKWLRRASVIGASVLGVALVAQLGFGKLKNPHNLRKQVSDDTNA